MQAKNIPHSHCHQCGTAYVAEIEGQEWPKRCPNDDCKNLMFVNPIPIGVMLQTVTDGDRTGILTPIRGHAPMVDFPGITGGYQEITDNGSEHAGAREKWEEISKALGIPMADEEDLELLCTRATGPFIPGRRQNLVFSVNPKPIHISAYDAFRPDAETKAIHISWNPEILAFPSHTYAVAKYFQRYQGVQPPTSYLRQPRTGDDIHMSAEIAKAFNIPYHQPEIENDIWFVDIAGKNEPVPTRYHLGRWEAVN